MSIAAGGRALRSRMRRGGWRWVGLALGFILVALCGCGTSDQQARQAMLQAQDAQLKAERAQQAADKARAAAEQAQIAADRAREAVDDATREINRAADHIDRINREREAAGD
jgi:multidrug efflux pump subunit AcrA (membrane-fusion protein)